MTKESTIDWMPAPGYVLCKPIKREELRAMDRKVEGMQLALADKAGKVSDSVGVGRVIEMGKPDVDDVIKYLKLLLPEGSLTGEKLTEAENWATKGVSVASLIAFMPYTDKLIEIDGEEYSLVAYKQIMGVRKESK